MLEMTAFIGGAAVMAIEIVASRILAPAMGNSIVVWSSLIGVILAALSWGYYQGGVVADKNPSAGRLSLILAIAAVLTAAIAVAKNPVLTAASRIPDIRISAVVGEIILFAPVSFFLAMVSPYVVRLKVKEVGSAGTTVGRLYAISSVGSIFGTFTAGYYLIAVIGSTAILFCISAVLFASSLMLSTRAFRKTKAVGVALAALCIYGAPATSMPLFKGKHILEVDTHYNHCLVYEGTDGATKRPIRSLVINPFARQSSMFLDNDDDFVLEYLKYFRLGNFFVPQARRALLLGGGGFSYPKDFFRRNPQEYLDVVELDPALAGIAYRYFDLSPNPHLCIFAEDARIYLNHCPRTYDLIYVDTFNSGGSVPYYMTTQETVRLVYNSLTPNGVAMVNLGLSEIEGPYSQFFHAELGTYKSVFPRVEVLHAGEGAYDLQSVLITAFKNPAEPDWSSNNPEIRSRLAHRWVQPVANDMPILTDDFAPVEIYVLRRFEKDLRAALKFRVRRFLSWL
jgi:spermidine synthase